MCGSFFVIISSRLVVVPTRQCFFVVAQIWSALSGKSRDPSHIWDLRPKWRALVLGSCRSFGMGVALHDYGQTTSKTMVASSPAATLVWSLTWGFVSPVWWASIELWWCRFSSDRISGGGLFQRLRQRSWMCLCFSPTGVMQMSPRWDFESEWWRRRARLAGVRVKLGINLPVFFFSSFGCVS